MNYYELLQWFLLFMFLILVYYYIYIWVLEINKIERKKIFYLMFFSSIILIYILFFYKTYPINVIPLTPSIERYEYISIGIISLQKFLYYILPSYIPVVFIFNLLISTSVILLIPLSYIITNKVQLYYKFSYLKPLSISIIFTLTPILYLYWWSINHHIIALMFWFWWFINWYEYTKNNNFKYLFFVLLTVLFMLSIRIETWYWAILWLIFFQSIGKINKNFIVVLVFSIFPIVYFSYFTWYLNSINTEGLAHPLLWFTYLPLIFWKNIYVSFLIGALFISWLLILYRRSKDLFIKIIIWFLILLLPSIQHLVWYEVLTFRYYLPIMLLFFWVLSLNFNKIYSISIINKIIFFIVILFVFFLELFSIFNPINMYTYQNEFRFLTKEVKQIPNWSSLCIIDPLMNWTDWDLDTSLVVPKDINRFMWWDIDINLLKWNKDWSIEKFEKCDYYYDSSLCWISDDIIYSCWGDRDIWNDRYIVEAICENTNKFYSDKTLISEEKISARFFFKCSNYKYKPHRLHWDITISLYKN